MNFTSGEVWPLYSIVHLVHPAEDDGWKRLNVAAIDQQKDSAALAVMAAGQRSVGDWRCGSPDSSWKCGEGRNIPIAWRRQNRRYTRNRERKETRPIDAKCETPATSCRQRRETTPTWWPNRSSPRHLHPHSSTDGIHRRHPRNPRRTDQP